MARTATKLKIVTPRKKTVTPPDFEIQIAEPGSGSEVVTAQLLERMTQMELELAEAKKNVEDFRSKLEEKVKRGAKTPVGRVKTSHFWRRSISYREGMIAKNGKEAQEEWLEKHGKWHEVWRVRIT